MADEEVNDEHVSDLLGAEPRDDRNNAEELEVLQARLAELQRLKLERQVKALEIEQELEQKEANPEGGQEDLENWVRTLFPRFLF
jgi:hypothetical protein